MYVRDELIPSTVQFTLATPSEVRVQNRYRRCLFCFWSNEVGPSNLNIINHNFACTIRLHTSIIKRQVCYILYVYDDIRLLVFITRFK